MPWDRLFARQQRHEVLWRSVDQYNYRRCEKEFPPWGYLGVLLELGLALWICVRHLRKRLRRNRPYETARGHRPQFFCMHAIGPSWVLFSALDSRSFSLFKSYILSHLPSNRK